jgi:hypothetical protein
VHSRARRLDADDADDACALAGSPTLSARAGPLSAIGRRS